jgi:soluble cytochrome b562
MIAMLLGVGIGACGGSDSNAESSSPPLTKAKFIKQASAICLENTEDILGPIEQYMSSHADSGKSKAELTADAVRQALLPRFQKQIDEIGALGFPSGDEQEIENFLESMQQAVDSLDSQQKLDLFTDLDEAFTSAKTRAEAYGLTSCL